MLCFRSVIIEDNPFDGCFDIFANETKANGGEWIADSANESEAIDLAREFASVNGINEIILKVTER